MSRFMEKLGLKKKTDPQAEMKKWKRELAKEGRQMEREIRKMEEAENKSKAECQKLAKAGRVDACKIIAKEIVRTRAARERLLVARTQISSVSMQLQTQAAMVRAAGCMKKSGEVMAVMNKLVKLPELQKTMMNMQREMERAGLVDEMIQDSMDMMDGDDIEDDTAVEVDKVVAELTGDLFKGKDADAPLPTSLPADAAPAAPVADAAPEEDEDDLDTMKARLQAL